ncbi:MAG: porin family protein [Bacteroidetes bacterium]|nr:porin family protein [Bacteroidota bacterium]
MKKLIVILTVFIAATFSSETTFAQFAFGFKLGYNASKLSANIDSIKSSMSSGFHVGAFARIGKKVFLQPEFYYTLSGASFENLGPSTVNDWKQKVTVGTLDIPVLIGINIFQTKIFKWRIIAGPMASFVVNSKITDVNLTGPIEKSDINSVNWYLQAGTGIDVLFLTLDIRYQVGLNKIINEAISSNGTVYPVNSTGNMFIVSVGFKVL